MAEVSTVQHQEDTRSRSKLHKEIQNKRLQEQAEEEDETPGAPQSDNELEDNLETLAVKAEQSLQNDYEEALLFDICNPFELDEPREARRVNFTCGTSGTAGRRRANRSEDFEDGHSPYLDEEEFGSQTSEGSACDGAASMACSEFWQDVSAARATSRVARLRLSFSSQRQRLRDEEEEETGDSEEEEGELRDLPESAIRHEASDPKDPDDPT